MTYLGIGLALLLFSVPLWPIRVLSEALIIGAGLSFLGAILALPRMIQSKRQESSYDLKDLHAIHEREELSRAQFEDSEEFDSIHCLACGEVYSIKLPVCPKCGHLPGLR